MIYNTKKSQFLDINKMNLNQNIYILLLFRCSHHKFHVHDINALLSYVKV
jgi:hypothetical protein